MFTLAGFVLTKVGGPFKPLQPLELKLSDYNPAFEGKADQNPIPFNKAQSFTCQPGQCIQGSLKDGYCGSFVSIDQKCSDIDASDIASVMDNDGLLIVDQNVANVSQVRMENYYFLQYFGMAIPNEVSPSFSNHRHRFNSLQTMNKLTLLHLSMEVIISHTRLIV